MSLSNLDKVIQEKFEKNTNLELSDVLTAKTVKYAKQYW